MTYSKTIGEKDERKRQDDEALAEDEAQQRLEKMVKGGGFDVARCGNCGRILHSRNQSNGREDFCRFCLRSWAIATRRAKGGSITRIAEEGAKRRPDIVHKLLRYCTEGVTYEERQLLVSLLHAWDTFGDTEDILE